MKCPYCGEEMKRGFIYGDRYSLKWIPEEKDKGLIFQWFARGIKLSDASMNNSVESFCCKNCKKIIIDVENKIDQRK
ncbi:hypothetical protein CIW83_02125 [Tissierella sp. P1]|uniref:PF20097 family protein n=1 Tax=Tissierella sp. P1 TaxID=1280483 RepID=UPI000B9FE5F7|nr:PF20097 family protein [Tissierella sp. P1]OZV13758.1 hypothetical protein CIW83_02125 [Tissierella sp. P1]